MTTLSAQHVEIMLSDDEGLTSLYFDFGDNSYFTICGNECEHDLYIERDEQDQGSYIKSIQYEVSHDHILFTLDPSAAEIISTDTELTITFNDKTLYPQIEQALKRITADNKK